MKLIKWKDPGRKRLTSIKHTDPNYCRYYDLDLEDFTELVLKIKSGVGLNCIENDRYGIYILTIAYIVQESPKFKYKPTQEREEMTDYQTLELLYGLPKFDPSRGSSIYSFAYRIGYTSACHFYTDKIADYNKQKSIIDHCYEELDEYLEEYDDHKLRNVNKGI